MADKTIKQLTTEFTSLTADDYFIAQRDTDNVTGKVKNSAVFNGGWSPVESPPDTVVANGNRSYTLTFNSLDLTDTISPGMRVRTTRTVAAPDQCTDLEASSSQYYNKTSPSGMTFTDDFVVSAWIKLESYPPSGGYYTIASRYNGTSGWELRVKTGSGQIEMYGWNGGAGNYSGAVSYQSVPLNKWVHVTAQLDMSTFTATTTTTYMMIDGVDIPCVVTRGGTNPTALIQAGNLEIGSTNSGTSPFDGKIAQVAIYSAKVTQATILASMNQGLTGSETSLISAYSFNNSINDLSATANNLTAQGSAVATNADSPFGNGGVSSTLDYALIQTIAFSTNTTIVAQVPEGCTIPTTGGVSSVAYSVQANPYGWVSDKGRWQVATYKLVSNNYSIGAINTWVSSYVKLSIPIGSWRVDYAGNGQLHSTAAGARLGFFAIGGTSTLTLVDANYTNETLSQVPYQSNVSDALGYGGGGANINISTMEVFTYKCAITAATGTESFNDCYNGAITKIYALPSGL